MNANDCSRRTVLILSLLAVAALAALAGCSTTEMKGTPFYTGEYEKREGPPEDRIPLWPILYYREPALSVLWPFIELTEEHFAIRPIYSVYGTNKKEQVHSILWPIGQLDEQRKENRVFPLFWWGNGEPVNQYFVGFPLYWHRGEPYAGEKGHDALFPFWIYARDGASYDAHFLWPIIRTGRDGTERTWRVWPFVGNRQDGDDHYRFLLWPLLHQWAGGTERGNSVLPFYWQSRDGDDRTLVTPLGGYGRDGDKTTWAVVPILGGGSYGKENGSYAMLLGLVHREWGKNRSKHHALPVYFYERSGKKEKCVVLPLMSGWESDGKRGETHVLLILGGSKWGGGKSMHYALPFYVYDQAGEKKTLIIPAMLGAREWDEKSSVITALLGLVRTKHGKTSRSHHVIPFYGYAGGKNWSRFISIPWSSRRKPDGDFWQLAPPFYYRARQDKSSQLYIFPYAGGKKENGDSWRLILPAWYRDRSAAGDRSSWFCPPLLSGGKRTPEGSQIGILPLLSGAKWNEDGSEAGLLAGLIYRQRDKTSSMHHVLPFYHYAAAENSRRFLSLPLSFGRNPDGSTWQLVPPVFYHGEDEQGERLITPLFASGSLAQDNTRWHTVIPLWYHRESDKGTVLATLFGGCTADADGRRWLIYPLLSGGRTDEESGNVWALAPLIHVEWDKESAAHHVLPFYYWNGGTRTFLSPLAAQWKSDDGGKTTLVPPALSWLTSGKNADGKDRKDLWLAGPLAHFGWDEGGKQQHILPAYYLNSTTETFASPIASWWRNRDDSKTTLVPPALSWLTSGKNADGKERKDLWLAGPLAHFGWDEDGKQQHVLPLYYLDSKSHTFLSALYASWGRDDARHRLYPPLLSLYSREGDRKDLWAALGLFRNRWGHPDQPNEGHLLPLYAYRGGESFYTPLFGWANKKDGFVYGPTPLFGVRTGEQRTGWWLWPLFSHKRDKETGNTKGYFLWGQYSRRGERRKSYIFPLYWRENNGPIDSEPDPETRHATYGTDFLCLPLFWHTNQSSVWTDDDNSLRRSYRKRHGLFPLWSHRKDHSRDNSRVDQRARVLWRLYNYERDVRLAETDDDEKTVEHTRTSVLWWLYDYVRDVVPAGAGEDEKAEDYTCARVLYRFWHYEKLNGDVSVDVFPGIAYDKKKNGFKQVSWIGRLFRYVKDPEKGNKLDLFFIPVFRSKPEQ